MLGWGQVFQDRGYVFQVQYTKILYAGVGDALSHQLLDQPVRSTDRPIAILFIEASREGRTDIDALAAQLAAVPLVGPEQAPADPSSLQSRVGRDPVDGHNDIFLVLGGAENES